MKILIALDATPSCVEIVQRAAARPWPAGSAFFLLHVLDPFPFAKAPISLQRAKDAAHAMLKNAAESLMQAGWKTETDVIFGHPRTAIGECAATWKADLVMIGSYNLSGITRLLLGSNAHSVLQRAPCSVEIVRSLGNGKEATRTNGIKILLATDGSEYSLAAIRSVASRPWPKGSEVRVLAVPEPFFPMGKFPYFASEEIESINTSALKEAKKHVDAGIEILSKAKFTTSTETPFPQDSPARVILKEAERWGAQMIVLGSHGRRGFDRLTMGSISEHVALHAHCSVEVIREQQTQAKKSQKGESQ
jgi:nucleotide-binding universal stress UspA family protein